MKHRKLTFFGDVFLKKQYKVDIELDDFIFNLEYPLSCDGIPAKNKINLCHDKSFIEETFGKLPIAVTLANNHIMDFGEEAFAKTVEYLEKNNIAYFGAGNETNNFNNPCIIDFSDKKIALIGYSCPTTHAVFGNDTANGSALLDEEKIIKDIHASKKQADIVIVNLHWGDEHIKYPKPSDVQIARNLIDAGAELIIGHHAHIIQSFEIHKGKYIFYGLGNFIFPDFIVPAKYDGKDFKIQYATKWVKENKQGVMVELDDKFNITYNTAEFDGDTIRSNQVDIPRWIPKTQKQYDLYTKFSRRLETVNRFLKNPRVPSVEQIKIFLGMKG